MGEKDYPPTARTDWETNKGIGNGLNPHGIHRIGSKYVELGEFLHEISSRFFAAINGAQHDWSGRGFDAFHAMGDRITNSVATNSAEGFQPYGNTIQNHSLSAAQAKKVIGNNGEYAYGTDNDAKAVACANALRDHFLPPGQDAFEELGYVSAPASPDGVATGGGGGAGAPGGGVSGGSGPSSPHSGGAVAPQSAESVDDGSAVLASGGDPSQDGAGAGGDKSGGSSPAGGATQGSGGGAGSPAGGSGSGPNGGGPSGPPPGGFDPQASGDVEGFAADDDASGLNSGGVGAFGGVGGIGGSEHERRLSPKTSGSAASQRFNVNVPKPSVPASGVIGGGGMAQMPASGQGKKADPERKSAAYLSSQKNIDELLGPAAIVSAEVLGELSNAELKTVEFQSKAQEPQSPEKASDPSAVPPEDGPKPRRKAVQP